MKVPKSLKLLRLAVVAAAVGVGSATFAAGAAATGNQSCVNLADMCVGEENSTNPTHYRGFAALRGQRWVATSDSVGGDGSPLDAAAEE